MKKSIKRLPKRTQEKLTVLLDLLLYSDGLYELSSEES